MDEMSGVTSASRGRLPRQVSHLQRPDEERHSDDHSLGGDVPRRGGSDLASILYFCGSARRRLVCCIRRVRRWCMS